MAKREPHPSTAVQHGEAWNEEVRIEGNPEPGNPPADAPPPPPQTMEERMARMEERLAAASRENELLRRSIPPAAPKAEAAPKPEPEPDWETELFQDPAGTLKKFGDRVAKNVETKLRGDYDREKGTERFWNGFFEANPDLKNDRDIVEMTLSKNLPQMANMPVSDAMEKLADLTRQRIMKYSKPPSGRKASVEGGEAPQPASEPQEPGEPVTQKRSISQLIRDRRMRRRGTQAA